MTTWTKSDGEYGTLFPVYPNLKDAWSANKITNYKQFSAVLSKTHIKFQPIRFYIVTWIAPYLKIKIFIVTYWIIHLKFEYQLYDQSGFDFYSFSVWILMKIHLIFTMGIP